MKRAMVMFLAAMVIIFGSGCGLIKETESGIEIEDRMIEYVEEKYDQKFEKLYVSYGDLFNPKMRMVAYPEGGDSVADQFVITREKTDGKEIFEDGYYGLFIREEYEEYIRDVIEESFPNCKYYTEILGSTLKEELTKEVSLEEALEIQALPIRISIFYIASDESEYTKIFNDFCIELLSAVPDVTVALIGLEEEDFNNLTRKNHEENIYKYNGNKYSRVNFIFQERWHNGEEQE